MRPRDYMLVLHLSEAKPDLKPSKQVYSHAMNAPPDLHTPTNFCNSFLSLLFPTQFMTKGQSQLKYTGVGDSIHHLIPLLTIMYSSIKDISNSTHIYAHHQGREWIKWIDRFEVFNFVTRWNK